MTTPKQSLSNTTQYKDHNTSALSGLWAALWDKVERNESTRLDSCIRRLKLPLHRNNKKSNTYDTVSIFASTNMSQPDRLKI